MPFDHRMSESKMKRFFRQAKDSKYTPMVVLLVLSFLALLFIVFKTRVS